MLEAVVRPPHVLCRMVWRACETRCSEDDLVTAWARYMCEQGISQEAAVSQTSQVASFLPNLLHNNAASLELSEVDDQALGEELAVSPSEASSTESW